MTLSLKQLVRRGFTTRQAQALIENTPEAPAAFPEHFANPTGDVAGLTAVVPLIGGAGDNDYYAGLVTIEAGTTLPPYVGVGSGREAGWNLFPADTAIVDSAIDDATTSYWPLPGHEHPPAGVYVAVYYSFAGLPAPTALPDGWTAGNTTGAGPVLPLLGFPYGSDPDAIFAGLVTVAPGAIVPPRPPGSGIRVWYLCRATTELDALVIADAVDIGWIGPHGEGPDPEPGVYLGVYYTVDGSVPTALPPGWSFQPYGVGAAGPVLAALGEAVKPSKNPPSIWTSSGGLISTHMDDSRQLVKFDNLDTVEDYTSLTGLPTLQGCSLNDEGALVIPPIGLFAVTWKLLLQGLTDLDGYVVTARVPAQGFNAGGSTTGVVANGEASLSGSFIEWIPDWGGTSRYYIMVESVFSTDGEGTPASLPESGSVTAGLGVVQLA